MSRFYGSLCRYAIGKTIWAYYGYHCTVSWLYSVTRSALWIWFEFAYIFTFDLMYNVRFEFFSDTCFIMNAESETCLIFLLL